MLFITIWNELTIKNRHLVSSSILVKDSKFDILCLPLCSLYVQELVSLSMGKSTLLTNIILVW